MDDLTLKDMDDLTLSQVRKRLVEVHGRTVAMRLLGTMIFLSTETSESRKAFTAKLMWEDLALIKKAGLAPDALIPSQLSFWTKFMFRVGFNTALFIAKLVPINGEGLDHRPSTEEIQAARALAKEYKLEDVIERAQQQGGQQTLPGVGEVK